MNTTISSKGQIVLPAEFRHQDDIRPGEAFDVERIDRGDYRLVRKSRRPNQGLVALLRACPAHNEFTPLDRNETTGTLRSPRFE